MSETALKRCPFCSYLPAVRTISGPPDVFEIRCVNTNCMVVVNAMASTKAGVIQKWNRRKRGTIL